MYMIIPRRIFKVAKKKKRFRMTRKSYLLKRCRYDVILRRRVHKKVHKEQNYKQMRLFPEEVWWRC